MTSLHHFSALTMLTVAVAAMPRMAAAESRDAFEPSAALVAQDTTFKPDGNYTLDLAVGGQAMTMTFSVEKKTDGSYAGVFRHAEMGEIPTTSFKVEGRKMSMEIMTPGGPGTVALTVNKENAVEGEWSMEGDGSKITGKKTS